MGPARGHRPGAVLDAAAGLPAVHHAGARPGLDQAGALRGRQLGGLRAVHALLLLRHRPAVRAARPGHRRGPLPGLRRRVPGAHRRLHGRSPRARPGLRRRGRAVGPAARPCPPVQSYYVVTCLLLSLCALLVTRAVLGLSGRRPWDAAMVGLSPLLLVHAFTNWDLFAVALATLRHVGVGAAAPGARRRAARARGRGEALPGAAARRAVPALPAGRPAAARGCGRRSRRASPGWSVERADRRPRAGELEPLLPPQQQPAGRPGHHLEPAAARDRPAGFDGPLAEGQTPTVLNAVVAVAAGAAAWPGSAG